MAGSSSWGLHSFPDVDFTGRQARRKVAIFSKPSRFLPFADSSTWRLARPL
jgi:hypothetical protein